MYLVSPLCMTLLSPCLECWNHALVLLKFHEKLISFLQLTKSIVAFQKVPYFARNFTKEKVQITPLNYSQSLDNSLNYNLVQFTP